MLPATAVLPEHLSSQEHVCASEGISKVAHPRHTARACVQERILERLAVLETVAAAGHLCEGQLPIAALAVNPETGETVAIGHDHRSESQNDYFRRISLSADALVPTVGCHTCSDQCLVQACTKLKTAEVLTATEQG